MFISSACQDVREFVEASDVWCWSAGRSAKGDYGSYGSASRLLLLILEETTIWFSMGVQACLFL